MNGPREIIGEVVDTAVDVAGGVVGLAIVSAGVERITRGSDDGDSGAEREDE